MPSWRSGPPWSSPQNGDSRAFHQVSCPSPAVSVATYPVHLELTISLNGQQYSADRLSYTSSGPRPSLMGVQPTAGPVLGGTRLNIAGVHLSGGSATFCRFNGSTGLGSFTLSNVSVLNSSSGNGSSVLVTPSCITPASFDATQGGLACAAPPFPADSLGGGFEPSSVGLSVTLNGRHYEGGVEVRPSCPDYSCADPSLRYCVRAFRSPNSTSPTQII